MNILTTLIDVVSGGIGGKIVDTVKDYFPPSMSDSDKATLEIHIKEATRKHEREILNLANVADKEFNSRIIALEGTSNDLKTIPFIGSLIIFLRGCQRPVWGLGTLFLDYQVFSGTWTLEGREEAVFFAINLLVLGFLFGERAVKNVLPLLESYLGKRK